MSDPKPTEAVEVKPCAFCGARAVFFYGAEGTPYKNFVKVSCAASDSDNCDEYPDGCSMEPETYWCTSEELAARLWNTRAPDQTAQVKQLKEENERLRILTESKPIDTAPKNGRILGHSPRRGWNIVRWDFQPYHKNPKPFWTTNGSRAYSDREDQPTHWIPLPLNPKEPI